jgi:hypothetical protein
VKIFRQTAAIGPFRRRSLAAAGIMMIRRPVLLYPVPHDDTVLKTSTETKGQDDLPAIKTLFSVTDKKLLSGGRSIGGLFLLVKDIMIYNGHVI